MAASCRRSHLPCKIPQRIRVPTKPNDSGISCPMGHSCPFFNRQSSCHSNHHSNYTSGIDQRVIPKLSDPEVCEFDECESAADEDSSDTFAGDEEELFGNSDYLATDEEIPNDDNDDSNNNFIHVDCNTHHFAKDGQRDFSIRSDHERSIGLSKSRSSLSIDKCRKLQNAERVDYNPNSYRPCANIPHHVHCSTTKLDTAPHPGIACFSNDPDYSTHQRFQPSYQPKECQRNPPIERNSRDKVSFNTNGNDRDSCRHPSLHRHCSMSRIVSNPEDASYTMHCPPDNQVCDRRAMYSSNKDDCKPIPLRRKPNDNLPTDCISSGKTPSHSHIIQDTQRQSSWANINPNFSEKVTNQSFYRPEDNCMLSFRRVVPDVSTETKRHRSPEKSRIETIPESSNNQIQNHSYPSSQRYCSMHKLHTPQAGNGSKINDNKYDCSSRSRKSQVKPCVREMDGERSYRNKITRETIPSEEMSHRYYSSSHPSSTHCAVAKERPYRSDPRPAGYYTQQARDGRPSYRGHYHCYSDCPESLSQQTGPRSSTYRR